MSYCNYCMAHLNDGETNCHRCGKAQNYIAPLHQLAPGTVLCDRYYIGSALGEGGFGITYIGRDLKLDMKVAIKEYFPSGFVNRSNSSSQTVSCSVQGDRKEYFEQGRDRFLREARTLARFSGTDGIVDVRDFFEENNTAYIVMEYLDGETLKENLVKNGVMAADDVIAMLMPVFKALKKIHAKDLIHRDISPDNIMLVEDKIKLLDFGSARNVTAAANKSLSVLLKPGYAPEEQYRSKGVQGPWTDIYALCATIYKCITGRTPEDSTDRLFEDSLKMPSEYGIAIDRETEAVIMKGLAVRAADRYQNIDEFLSALENRKTIPLAAEEIKTEKIEETEEKTVGVWGETVVSETPEMPETSEIAESEETVSIWSETVAPVTPEVPEIPCNTDESEETVCIWSDDNAVNETVNPEPEKVELPPVETETEKTESIWSQTEEKTGTAEKPEKGKKKIVGVIIAVVIAIFVIAGIVFANIGSSDNYDEPDVPEDNYVEETPDVPEETTLDIAAQLGDDLGSGKIAIDGVIYQVGSSTLADFTNNGYEWIFVDEIEANMYGSAWVVLTKGDINFSAFVVECAPDFTFENGLIAEFVFNSDMCPAGSVILPCDIRLGEVRADIGQVGWGGTGGTEDYDYYNYPFDIDDFYVIIKTSYSEYVQSIEIKNGDYMEYDPTEVL